MIEDPFDTAKALMETLEELAESERVAKAYIARICEREVAEQKVLQSQMDQLRDRLSVVSSEMQERADQGFDDLRRIQLEREKTEDALKSHLRSLPIGLTQSGVHLTSGKFEVTVTRSQTSVVYRDEAALLEKLRRFAHVQREGDTLVRQSLNIPLLERLLAENVIPKEEVAGHREEVRTRTPQIRIVERTHDDEGR